MRSQALSLLCPLSNRAAASGKFIMPADGWFMLAPVGEHPHAESGMIQAIDDISVRAQVASFALGGELLIDLEHESYDPEKRTTAAGWIQELEGRPDALWMRPRWTDIGEAALIGGSYRFISPVWLRADCERLGNNRVRPLRLDSAGLTNMPNLKGLPALSNSARTEAEIIEAEQAKNHTAEFFQKAGVPFTNPRAAIEVFNARVAELQTQKKWTFERAWNSAKTLHPELWQLYCAVQNVSS